VTTFGPKSVYIGNIETNLPTTFTLNLQLESTTISSIVLPVTLSYMDNLRMVHNVTLNIPVSIDQTSEPAEPSPNEGRATLFGLPMFLWVVMAVIVIVAVVIWYKKR
jgi:hypothetical protein